MKATIIHKKEKFDKLFTQSLKICLLFLQNSSNLHPPPLKGQPPLQNKNFPVPHRKFSKITSPPEARGQKLWIETQICSLVWEIIFGFGLKATGRSGFIFAFGVQIKVPIVWMSTFLRNEDIFLYKKNIAILIFRPPYFSNKKVPSD